MISLAIFLSIWLVLVFINGILTLITLGQFFKHATPSPLAYGYAIIFIGVMIAAVLGCGGYFLNVDWDQKVNLVPSNIQSVITGSHQAQDTPLEP
jgi:hypothetical protein